MKVGLAGVIIVTGLFQVFQSTALSDSFKWSPITPSDWAIRQDSSKGIRDAVMIFEKMTEDDHDFERDECHLTVYRRIQIFNANGKEWGDVTAPYYSKDQEIEEIKGRTVLPDGSQVPLLESQIHEKEIYKSEGTKIKEKSFSLPGLTDSCIVDYYLKYRFKQPNRVWLIQKEIVLLHGEYLWKFYRGESRSMYPYDVVRQALTPNFLWLNTGNVREPGKVEQRPNIKEPEEVVFSMDNVPAFEREPHSLSDRALLTQLRLYYGTAAASGAYWGELASSIVKGLEKFTKDDDRVRAVLASIEKTDSLGLKIKAAYDWLQKNIKNVTYEKQEKDFDENENVNDVLKHKYGTSRDMNIVFYDMLREMNIDSKILYVLDRNEGLVIPDAKYWQFDGSLVAVIAGAGQYEYCSPGDIFLPQTHIPEENEGTLAMLVGDQSKQFVNLPFSVPALNRTRHIFTLTLDNDLKLAGSLKETCHGHEARDLHLAAYETDSTDRQDKMRKQLEEQFPDAQIDSVSAGGLDDLEKPVTLECSIHLPTMQQQAAGRILIQPFGALSKIDNPFQAEHRSHVILFDHAYELSEIMSITVPDTFAVESLPADSTFANRVGACEVAFKNFDQNLSIQRMFRLNSSIWSDANYDLVKSLFQTRQSFDRLTVVLKRR